MPITPYALNVKAVDVSQPLNTLAAIRQMQAQGQQQQMNALAMEKAQRDMAQSDALRNAFAQYTGTPESERAIIAAGGLDAAKSLASIRSSKSTEELNKQKLLDTKNKMYQQAASRIQTPTDAQSFLKTAYADEIYGPMLQQLQPLESALQHIPTDKEGLDRFVGMWSNGPAWALEQAKAKTAAAAAAQSQDQAMKRTIVGQQAQAAADILNRGLRFDEKTGNYTLNPGYTQDQILQARKVLDQFVAGTIPGDNPAMNLPLPTTAPAPAPTNLPADMKQPIEPTPLAGGSEIPTRVAPPPGAPGGQPIPNPPATAAGLPGVVSSEQLRADRAKMAGAERTAEKEADLVIEEPDMRNSVLSNMSLANKTIDQITTLLNDPALKNVTGNWAGSVPSLTTLIGQGNANANALIKALRSKAWLNSVKAFGKSSGLSPITDQEGAKLEAAYAILDQTQGTPEFKKALLDFQSQLESSNKRIVNAYNEKYGKLNIQGWQPMSLIGEFPDEAIQQLKADPTPKNIKFFNDHFGNDTAKYFLQGVK